MKKNICMSFFLILFSQCSAVADSEEIFLKFFQGTWKTTDPAELWFRVQLDPPVTVAPDTVVDVATDGTFTIGGITFTFVEIEVNGILAVYEFTHNSIPLFVGIGIGEQDDVLISPSAVTSIDQVISIDKGEIFLIK